MPPTWKRGAALSFSKAMYAISSRRSATLILLSRHWRIIKSANTTTGSGQRQDMVDFLGRGDLTGPPALLAQWVGRDIAVTISLSSIAPAKPPPRKNRIYRVFTTLYIFFLIISESQTRGRILWITDIIVTIGVNIII